MDFDGSQYVVYRHTDMEHDHVHIVASRIRITDGTVWVILGNIDGRRVSSEG